MEVPHGWLSKKVCDGPPLPLDRPVFIADSGRWGVHIIAIDIEHEFRFSDLGEHNRFLRQVGVRERLPPEVSNATEIGHSNVCKPFKIHTGSPRQGEIDFLTMEFLEGEPLPIDCATGRCPRTSDR
jgi:hypothetical protein